MKKKGLYLVMLFVLAMTFIIGCTGVQESIVDPNSGLNQGVGLAQQVANNAPAIIAAVPGLGAFSSVLVTLAAIVSSGGNLYQAVRGAVVKKTARAIVQAVEQSPQEVQDAIKPLVATNMNAAGISNQGKNIVSSLK